MEEGTEGGQKKGSELTHLHVVASVPGRFVISELESCAGSPSSSSHSSAPADLTVTGGPSQRFTAQNNRQTPSGGFTGSQSADSHPRGGERRAQHLPPYLPTPTAHTHTRTMESAGNGSDLVYRGQIPGLYNSSGRFCGNFTDGNNNNTSFAEAQCDGEPPLTGSLDDDTNPVIIAIVITALYSIVCVVGLVGNVLVMYIIVR